MKTTSEVITRFEQVATTDIHSMLVGLTNDELGDLEEWARHELHASVRPLRSGCGDEAIVQRHRALSWLVAEAAGLLGRRDELRLLLYGRWREDVSDAARLVETLIDMDRKDEAAVVARVALHEEVCAERERMERALESICAPPPGWRASLEGFARAPSVEAWRELMRFTPEGLFYARSRAAMRTLMAMNVDGNILFACATDIGMTPDAIALVEEGKVDPEVVLERASKSTPQGRGLWMGLAARAAHAKGDDFRAVRLMSDAFRCSHRDWPPIAEAVCLHDDAGEELRAMLAKAGIPSAFPER